MTFFFLGRRGKDGDEKKGFVRPEESIVKIYVRVEESPCITIGSSQLMN